MQKLACIFVLTSFGAWAQTKPSIAANREWLKVAVQDRLNQGDLQGAAEVLKEHLKVDQADAAAWAQLALVQTRTSQCDQAQSSLLRAAQVAVASAQSVYLQGAEQLKMRGCGAVAIDIETSSVVKNHDFSGSVSLRSGYDSNVMLLADAAPSLKDSPSAFVNPTVQLNYARAYDKGILNATSVSALTSYFDKSVRSFDNIFQSIGLEWRPQASTTSVWSWSAGTRYDLSLVRSSGFKFFSGTNTLFGSFSKSTSAESLMGFDANVGYQNFSDGSALTAADKRDGVTVAPSAWYSKRYRKILWTAALTLSKVMAEGDNYKSFGATAMGGASGDLYSSVRYRASLSYGFSDYTQHASDRNDRRLDAMLNLSYTLASRSAWSFATEYTFSRNQSTVSSYSYNRSTILGQVIYAF